MSKYIDSLRLSDNKRKNACDYCMNHSNGENQPCSKLVTSKEASLSTNVPIRRISNFIANRQIKGVYCTKKQIYYVDASFKN